MPKLILKLKLNKLFTWKRKVNFRKKIETLNIRRKRGKSSSFFEKTKKNIQKNFLIQAGHSVLVYVCLFETQILASYIPKKKVVTVLSSFHYDDYSIDKDSGDACQPNIITFYNITKSGVDTVDQKCAAYHVSRNTCRRPMVIFYNLLNIAGINAHVIHKCNTNEGEIISERRLCLKAIGLALVRENIRIRARDDPRLEKDVRNIAQKLSGTPADPAAPRPNKRGRCGYCPNRKTKVFLCQMSKMASLRACASHLPRLQWKLK